MDELRKRCEDAAWGVVLDDPFEVRIDELNMVKVVDAVLAEIDKAGYEIVPKGSCECEDCYPEVTRAAGRPLPESARTITWGWGETR